MIQVTYWPGLNRVTVQGHARSGEDGKDLVCAGASTLAVTLAANVQWLADNGYLREKVVRLEKGEAEIQCIPRSRYADSEQLMMRSVTVGFEALARQYPDYIDYERRG